MKRQVIAVALGSLFALPAFAFDGEINAGLSADAQSVSAQPYAQVYEWRGLDGEIGNVAPQAVANPKSRAEVVADIERRAIDGETGQALLPNA